MQSPRPEKRRTIMTDFGALPDEYGKYFVYTTSGTVHVMDNTHSGRATWERRPSEDAPKHHYDRIAKPISKLEKWAVGAEAQVIAADSSYLTSPTSHRTSVILRITDQEPTTPNERSA